MKSKVLHIDPLKCDGCRECETACAEKHNGTRSIGRKRIGIVSAGPVHGDGKGIVHVPSTCQQCEDPPCMAICPKKAIRREHNPERVVLDPALCVGCTMCVSACPTGSMSFAHDVGLAYKCELCEGDPECVRVCDRKALEYLPSYRMHQPRVRESALRLLRSSGAKVSSSDSFDD